MVVLYHLQKLVTDLQSVTCYDTDVNTKGKCSFRNSKSLYLDKKKKGLKKVIIRLSTLRTWMLTSYLDIFVNEADEETVSKIHEEF